MSAMRRPGIALPMALLVLVALGLLSSLALTDALQSARTATLAEDEARARAAVLDALAGASTPPDLPWLCLQPPAQPVIVVDSTPSGQRIELRWWALRPGVIRVELTGFGRHGARHRRVGWMRPDSLDPTPLLPGCPAATRLLPAGPDWLGGHPEG
ncbi:MAG: hypothetical protein C0503_11735 [Gemmatimonas sp.]|nr:hypothetical protein [Gemmatimonas sp.]